MKRACDAWLSHIPTIVIACAPRIPNGSSIRSRILFPGWLGIRSECSVAKNFSATRHFAGRRRSRLLKRRLDGVRGISTARAQSLPGSTGSHGFRGSGKAHVRPIAHGNHARKSMSVLFESFGFRGNTEDYYDPRNSFFNDVLDRRVGIPNHAFGGLSGSCATPEFSHRGVGMPGHFIVKYCRSGAGVLSRSLQSWRNSHSRRLPRRLHERYGDAMEFSDRLLARVTQPPDPLAHAEQSERRFT